MPFPAFFDGASGWRCSFALPVLYACQRRTPGRIALICIFRAVTGFVCGARNGMGVRTGRAHCHALALDRLAGA